MTKTEALVITIIVAVLAAIALPMAIPESIQAATIYTNTGLQSPSANYPMGSNSFFHASDAFEDNGGVARGGDSWIQVYYNYDFPIPSGAHVYGIEVRTDALLKDDPHCTWGKFRISLSWNGGSNWTTYYETPALTTSEVTYILGSPTDGWGRIWDYTEFSNANFRVQIVSQTDCFCFLDWLPVLVYYSYEVQPDLAVDPTSIDFNSTSVGSSSSAKTVTVTNDGSDDLVIGTISITGTDLSQFSKQNDNCSGQTLAPAASATLKVVFSPTSSGAKSATLSIPSNDPSEPTVDVTLNGTGNVLPIADFSAMPPSGNEPLTIILTDLSTSVDGVISRLWNFGDGQTSNKQNPTHKYAQNGTYTVSLTITEADSDSDTKTDYITVYDTRPTAGFSATPLSGDEPLTVSFTDLSTSYDGITSWLWDFGDSQTSTKQNPTHQYAQDGTYSVSLTVTETDGDNDTETKTGYIIVNKILARQTISPDNPAIVKSEDEQIIIEFPVGSVVNDAAVTIREESQVGVPACPSGFKAGATCFSVYLTAELVPGTVVTITVKYSNTDLEACGGDTNKLTLSRYDENTNEWVILSTTTDTEAMTLTASTDQFSTWMVMVNESPAKKIALWIWLVSVFGGLGILFVISSAFIMKRSRVAKVNKSVREIASWPTGMNKEDWF